MSTGVIDHDSSRSGRWLQERRIRISLWIAVLEVIVVALAADVSRWTVIGIAILAIALYLLAGRSMRWDAGHQVLWIFAFSQSLAVVGTILSFIVFWFALILAAMFALVALVVLFTDRR
jgi:hypothetical protein